MNSFRQELDQLVRKWQQEADRNDTDDFKYTDLLDDLLFQSDMRFGDYVQFDIDGPFPFRLKKWLDNIKDDQEQKALFRLLRWIIFIDDKQMQSLYRDAYRSKLIPWINENNLGQIDLLAPDYHRRLLGILRQYYFCSITESFNISFFKQVNSLIGLPKLEILGERKNVARKRIEELASNKKKKGLVIFEDMVGTGNQAVRVLKEISKAFNSSWKSLFIPLLVLPTGLRKLNNAKFERMKIHPVLVIPEPACLKENLQPGEPKEFKYVRSLVKKTAPRVIESFHEYDDVPVDEFGYEGSGALIVTSHNAPNNTLPLIHHRAPDWRPLFRRVHHLKDD